MGAVDASMERHAPRINNPLTPTDQNLEDGMKLYTMNCALCHGGLDRKPSTFATSFYPPPPNLISDPPDDPEWHIFYTIRTGIRYTGMPSWDKTLSEPDMWKITMLLSHLDKLPPPCRTTGRRTSMPPPPQLTKRKKAERSTTTTEANGAAVGEEAAVGIRRWVKREGHDFGRAVRDENSWRALAAGENSTAPKSFVAEQTVRPHHSRQLSQTL